MTKRLFVFDMDGVLVGSEKMWIQTEPRTLEELFGREIARGIGDTIGASIGAIYEKAKELGARLKREEFDRRYNEVAIRVYGRCEVSQGVGELVAYLVAHGWTIALLSSAPMLWINQVLPRLSWRDNISTVLSLNEHQELRAKPSPDGYQYLLRQIGATENSSVALEDSNPGIAAARAAGLFTIGYREHLPDGYVQKGADVTANSMREVRTCIAGWDV